MHGQQNIKILRTGYCYKCGGVRMVVGLGPFAYKVKIYIGIQSIKVILKPVFTSFVH